MEPLCLPGEIAAAAAAAVVAVVGALWRQLMKSHELNVARRELGEGLRDARVVIDALQGFDSTPPFDESIEARAQRDREWLRERRRQVERHRDRVLKAYLQDEETKP